MKPIRVVIVDDSAVIRALANEILSAEPDIEVVGAAGDPYEAREVIKRVNPDVVTLDIEMPRMDGLDFLERLMRLRPMPVVMFSSLTQKGADETLRALELGAVDCIAKLGSDDAGNIEVLTQELPAKIRAAAAARIGRVRAAPGGAAVPTFDPRHATRDLIAIGASTGGVEALRDMLERLPEMTPPIVITQHMPPVFTASFAQRLDTLCRVHVLEAAHRERLQPGTVYIAPGGRHMEVSRQSGELITLLSDGEPVSGHKPSVDVLFYSVAKTVGEKAVGIILTGMGSDGAAGLGAMRGAGAHTLGQNEESCVVYGMPRVARERGAVTEELALARIPARMLEVCSHRERMEKRA